MRETIKNIPLLGAMAKWLHWQLIGRRGRFPGSERYWERRYVRGGDSGVGSQGKFAVFKAEVINDFVSKHNIRLVIEYGCGDGDQLVLARYPEYIGFDVSERAVFMCRKTFGDDDSKSFKLISEYEEEKAALTLSLDVIYHLVEDEVFEAHMRMLFGTSEKYVMVYSSDSDDNRGYEGTHVWHRQFTRWVERNLEEWELIEHMPNRYPYRGDYTQGSFADFYVYCRRNEGRGKITET